MFRKKDWTYAALLSAFALLVILVAEMLGLGRSFPLGNSGEKLTGYWNSHWTPLFFWALPLAYLLQSWHRSTLERQVDELITSGTLVIGSTSTNDVKKFFIPSHALLIAFCLALALNVVDYTTVMEQQLKTYTVADITAAATARAKGEEPPAGTVHEPDWSIFSQFSETGTTRRRNSFFNLLAYSQQFAISFLALALFARSIAFSIAFLRSVWLRSKPPKRGFYVKLNLNDEDYKLGYGELGGYFNINLLLLALAGVLCLVSRLGNVGAEAVMSFLGPISLSDPIQFISVYTFPRELVPDVGQAILILSWGAIFVGMLLPGLAKFLPLIVWSGRPLRGASHYLAELFPDNQLGTSVDESSARFRSQSFWPSGAGQASFCVILAAIVQVWLCVPINPLGVGTFGSYAYFVLLPGVTLGLSVLGAACVLLWFVDKQLSACLTIGKPDG